MNKARFVVTLLALLVGGVSAFSQLPAAKLTTVFPPGAKAGTSVEVTIGGAHLDHADRMFFSHPGISAKSLGDGRRFSVTVTADVPGGVHSAWVAGHYGASAPRAFAVGRLHEVVGLTGNHAFESAPKVGLDSVVNGHADAEAADFYKVTLKRGQVLSARCLDREIDSRMQGAVLIFDDQRREVARGRLSGATTYRAERDGDCYLKVHDFVYRGGPEYFYRLELRAGELPGHVLPLAVEPGAARPVQVFGVDVTKPLRQEKVTVSSGGDLRLAGLPLRDRHATVSGVPVAGQIVGMAAGKVVVESADWVDQTITLPADISGRFYPARDVDRFHFSAKKGEVWQVEIVSHRLHGLTDPRVVVQRVTVQGGKTNHTDVVVLEDADRNFGGDEFDTFHHDDTARLEIKEDGNYRIVARDVFNSAVADPRRTYRLIVRRAEPDFDLIVQPMARRPEGDRRDVWAWNAILRQGDVAGLRVLVFRRDGFNSEIEVAVDGLPAGVSFGPLRIGAADKTAELFLRADETAKPWAGPITLKGRATVGERRLERAARFAFVNWDIDFNNSTTDMPDVRLADRLVLGICAEPSPLELVAGDGKPIEAVTGSTVKIPVRVVRRGDFKADLKVKPHGHAALAKIGDATIKGGAGEVVIDLKRYKLPVGEHALHLETTSKGKYKPTSPELIAARADLGKATAVAKPAEEHAKALAEVFAIKTLSPAQKAAVKRESDEAGETAKDLIAKREAAAKRVKDLEAKLKPRDITADFYSMPFVIKVNPKK